MIPIIDVRRLVGNSAAYQNAIDRNFRMLAQPELYQSAALAQASATSLTTITAANITSLSLTAGDWDVQGQVYFIPANTTTVTQLIGSLNTTSATLAGNDSKQQTNLSIPFTSTGMPFSVLTPVARFSLVSTTTIYLIGYANFAVSTTTAFGAITARRTR